MVLVDHHDHHCGKTRRLKLLLALIKASFKHTNDLVTNHADLVHGAGLSSHLTNKYLQTRCGDCKATKHIKACQIIHNPMLMTKR